MCDIIEAEVMYWIGSDKTFTSCQYRSSGSSGSYSTSCESATEKPEECH